MLDPRQLLESLDKQARERLESLAGELGQAKRVAIDPAQLLANILPAVLGEASVAEAVCRYVDALRSRLGTAATTEIRALAQPGRPGATSGYPGEFAGIQKGAHGVLNARQYRCPFCESEFTSPALKGKSMVIEMDERYQLSRYMRTTDPRREYVDFSRFEITVCPVCLYAGQDAGFNFFDNAAVPPKWREQKLFKITKAHMTAMSEGFARRRQLAAAAGKGGLDLFSTARSRDDATVAIDLAASALQTLGGLAENEEKHVLWYQRGVLFLMKAKQFEQMAGEVEAAEAKQACASRRREALAAALEEFVKVEGTKLDPLGFQTITTYYVQKFFCADELGEGDARSMASGAICQSYDRYCIRDRDKTPMQVKRVAKWGRDLIEFRIYELSKEKRGDNDEA